MLDSSKPESADDNFENGGVLQKGRKHREKKKLLFTSNFSIFQCFQKICTADTKKQEIVNRWLSATLS